MLKVITGTAKGCKLKKPHKARPISNRAKSSLFSIIGNDILDKRVLDLYAGSGALGIESLSRGAKHCCFVDLDRHATEDIAENLKKSRLTNKAEVKQQKAFQFLGDQPQKSFDIVFADPPYKFYKHGTQKLKDILARIKTVIVEGGAIILKYPSVIKLPELEDLVLADTRTFGTSSVAIWVKMKSDPKSNPNNQLQSL